MTDILDLFKIFKKASLFLLKCREQILLFQLGLFVNKNKSNCGKFHKGCTLSLDSEIKAKKDLMNAEIITILKEIKNDPELIKEYIKSNGTPIFELPDTKKLLSVINEEQGLICEHKGFRALIINLYLFKKISFKSNAIFIIDKNYDTYKLLKQFHMWFAMKNGFEGFDEKSQIILSKVNNGNKKILKKLSLQEMINFRQLVARNAEAARFVVQYINVTDGSKQALKNITENSGASI